MGIFASLFGRSNGDSPERFVSKDGFRRNLAKQTTMSPLTISQLREHGVAESSQRKLEFFFYTSAASKAAALANARRELGYLAEAEKAAHDKRLQIVTGWTTPMLVSEQIVVAWTEQMCRLGYEHDAEFDGWGTHLT